MRYYLDFCLKYEHSIRDPETALLFLQKLGSKGQSLEQQEQAGACIALFREVATRFPAKGKEQDQSAELNDWGEVLIFLQVVIRSKQYAKSTGRTYRHWALQFQEYLEDKPVSEVTDDDAVAFLSWLAVHRRVVAATQNQAFKALLFLFRHVLKRPYELGDKVKRAGRTRYVPVVFSREELNQVFEHMEDPYRLIAKVLYGCGLRLTEGLTLRVEQLNFSHKILTVHPGKGPKDWAMPLPVSLNPRLETHLAEVKKTGINKRVGSHTLRYSFASHLLLANILIGIST